MPKTKTIKKIKVSSTNLEETVKNVEKSLSKDSYRISLNVNGENFSSDNQNLRDAIVSLFPEKMGTKAIVKVEYQGKVSERIIFGVMVRKIKNNKVFADIFIKNLLIGLK